MTTVSDILRLHDRHPDWTAPQIADELGCLAAYVRAATRRKGVSLPRAILWQPRALIADLPETVPV